MLYECDNNQSAAARVLGIDPKTLRSKLIKYGFVYCPNDLPPDGIPTGLHLDQERLDLVEMAVDRIAKSMQSMQLLMMATVERMRAIEKGE